MADPVGAAPTPDASEAEVLETSRPAADRGSTWCFLDGVIASPAGIFNAKSYLQIHLYLQRLQEV